MEAENFETQIYHLSFLGLNDKTSQEFDFIGIEPLISFIDTDGLFDTSTIKLCLYKKELIVTKSECVIMDFVEYMYNACYDDYEDKEYLIAVIEFDNYQEAYFEAFHQMKNIDSKSAFPKASKYEIKTALINVNRDPILN